MLGNLLENYPAFLEKKLDELWLTEKLEAALPVLRCFDARKVLLTGNSEGYAAAVSVLQLFQGSDVFWGGSLVSQAKYNYGGCKHELGIGEPNTPLVIITDLDGNDGDVADSIKTTREIGGISLLITVCETSDYAAQADFVLSLGTVRNMDEAYSAAVLALIAVAYRIGRVRGQYSEMACRRVRQAIMAYAQAVAERKEPMMEAARRFASQVYDKTVFDCIGDGPAEAVINFSACMMTRYAGCLCAQNDSEEWCHGNSLLQDRLNTPVIAAAPKASPAYSRFCETLRNVQRLERPYLAVTDGGEEDFCEGTRLCRMPQLPEEYGFLCALFFHLPVVAAYESIAELREGGTEA